MTAERPMVAKKHAANIAYIMMTRRCIVWEAVDAVNFLGGVQMQTAAANTNGNKKMIICPNALDFASGKAAPSMTMR